MASKPKNSSCCWNPACSKTSVELKRCARCQSAWYCGRDCQVAHYKDHKKDCLRLQTKKVQKDEKKAYKKSSEFAAMQESNTADMVAQMMADTAGRMAANIQNPAQRARMEKYSRDMAAAVQKEKQKKESGQFDPSWIHDEEARKKAVDEIAEAVDEIAEEADKQINAYYESRGMKSPHLSMMEKAIQQVEAESRGEAPPETPIARNSRIIIAYLNRFGSSETSSKPQSMDSIVEAIEPVLQAAGEQLDMLHSLRSPSVRGDYSSKLGKLACDVAEKKALTPSVKASYSPDNLASIENKWKHKVFELMMLTMSGGMEGMALSQATQAASKTSATTGDRASPASSRTISELVADLSAADDRDGISKAFLGLIEVLNNDLANSRPAIVHAGGIETTLKLMRQHPQVMSIQGFGCTILHAAADVNDESKQAIRRGGGIPLLLAAVKNHTEHEIPRQQGILALQKLTDLISSDLAAEAIAVILKAMKIPDVISEWKARDIVAASGILATLTFEASSHVDNCRAFVRTGGVPTLVAALLHSCKGLDAHNHAQCVIVGAQVAGMLMVLTNIARFEPSSHVIVRDTGVLEVVLLAMQTFETAPTVQGQACCFISTLPNQLYATLIASKTGGIPLVVQALEVSLRGSSPEYFIAQKFAMMLLYGLSTGNPGNVIAIRKAGGVQAVARALQRKSPDREQLSDLYLKGMSLLWCWIHVICDNDRGAVSSITSEIISCQGIPAIVFCMEQMADVAEIQVIGCMLLAPLSHQDDGNPSAVLAGGGRHALEKAKMRHKNHAEIQKLSCMALDYLEDG